MVKFVTEESESQVMENERQERIYPIVYPAIKSASVYFFTTDSGIEYEVRFGRRADNILHATIVFGVINDEFEGEEYITTNKGEVYTVMNTISEIVRTFMHEHPKIMIFEFNALDKDDEKGDEGKKKKHNARMLLYRRYLPKIFDQTWTFHIDGNNAMVKKNHP